MKCTAWLREGDAVVYLSIVEHGDCEFISQAYGKIHVVDVYCKRRNFCVVHIFAYFAQGSRCAKI